MPETTVLDVRNTLWPIVRCAAERGANPLPRKGFRNVPGHGATAEVDGHQVAVGNRKLIVDQNVGFGELMNRRDEFAVTGRTAVLVTIGRVGALGHCSC